MIFVVWYRSMYDSPAGGNVSHSVCVCVCVYTCLHMCVCIWNSWSISTSVTVQLHIHARCVCVCVRDSICCDAASLWSGAPQLSDHLCSTVTVLSCWMFGVSREGSAHDSHWGLSSRLICVGTHTHAPYTHHHLTLEAHTHTHPAWGSVTVPQRGCWVRFYCPYWSWLGPSGGIDMWIIGGS